MTAQLISKVFLKLWHIQKADANTLKPYITGHTDTNDNVCFMCICGCHATAVWPHDLIIVSLCISIQYLPVLTRPIKVCIWRTWISAWNEVAEFLCVAAHWPSWGKWAAKDQLSTAPQMCVRTCSYTWLIRLINELLLRPRRHRLTKPWQTHAESKFAHSNPA